MDEPARGSGAASILGLAIVGAMIVGVAGLILAVFAVFNEFDYVGAGLLLIASAIAFGMAIGALSRFDRLSG